MRLPSARTVPISPTEADVLVQRFSVPYEYPVYFTEGVLAPENPTLARALCLQEPNRRHRFAVVLDDGVARAWPSLPTAARAYADHAGDCMQLLSDPLVVPGGETAKNDPQALGRVHAFLDRLGIDRHSFVVVIGGGAVQDMAGYAAATAHRGVRVVRVPTTVLSQADSGVGVKNGVNAFGKKNTLGTFSPPHAVLCDRLFLSTLAPRDLRAGMAEGVKVALVKDPAFFRWICDNKNDLAALERNVVARLVRRSAELHLAHIATSGDPFEQGSARPLDFGHWAAHKLEVMTNHALRHGEAVAIGMALDTLYSKEIGLLGGVACNQIVSLLRSLGYPLWHDAIAKTDASGRPLVLAGLAEFREHLGGELTITLLADIGAGREVHDIDMPTMLRSIDLLLRAGT
ncbi:MAG: 3-dehydroquinate synthase [Deltaproteobacteria bacterium]|nr:3-dehydroquinate synthase [Deltaproteobacteria bacterium]